jgi:hypothetical protein
MIYTIYMILLAASIVVISAILGVLDAFGNHTLGDGTSHFNKEFYYYLENITKLVAWVLAFVAMYYITITNPLNINITIGQ